MRGAETIVNDNSCNIIEHTGDIIWVRFKASILPVHDAIEYNSWVNLRVWLNDKRSNASSVWCTSFAYMWKLDVVETKDTMSVEL